MLRENFRKHTHLYLEPYFFGAFTPATGGVAHIYFSNLSFYRSTKKLVEHFRAGLSVLRRDDLGKHFIAFDTMVKNAQGSDSKKCNW